MAYCRRNQRYRKHWKELVSMYGSMCFWCREEPATCIDHCIPYSWDQNNDIDNLVPACITCNALAGSKMFESVEHKRQYIMEDDAPNAAASCCAVLNVLSHLSNTSIHRRRSFALTATMPSMTQTKAIRSHGACGWHCWIRQTFRILRIGKPVKRALLRTEGSLPILC